MPLTDIDLLELDAYADGAPHHLFDRLRSEAPVFRHPEPDGPGFWAVTRHADVQYVSRTPSMFGSFPNTNIADPEPERLAILGEIMLNMDPPRHNAYRNTINKGFVPKRIAKLESYITGVAEGIVDAIAPRGECDFVEDVAALLPMTMICELFGIPDADRRRAYELANRLTSADDPEIQENEGSAEAALAETFEFAVQLGAEKKKTPADDLASLMINAEIDGKPVDDLMFGTFVLMMIVAGNETTRTVTSNGMLRLIEHPEQKQALVDDPSRIPAAVEEILRFEPGVHHFRRTAREDTELGGESIREGDKVVVWYPRREPRSGRVRGSAPVRHHARERVEPPHVRHRPALLPRRIARARPARHDLPRGAHAHSRHRARRAAAPAAFELHQRREGDARTLHAGDVLTALF